jgi:hypothetical protein
MPLDSRCPCARQTIDGLVALPRGHQRNSQQPGSMLAGSPSDVGRETQWTRDYPVRRRPALQTWPARHRGFACDRLQVRQAVALQIKNLAHLRYRAG